MFDVAVIGQGPAGGMAALRLAEAGHSVVAFDRKKRVGDPIHCGEGLGKIALEHTNYPVGDWAIREVKGNRIRMPNGKAVGLMSPGYSIHRWGLDSKISDDAVAAGTERHEGIKISKVTKENGHWDLFSKDGEVAKAKQLVIAEGRVPNIVTQVGLKGNDKLRLLPGLQYKFRMSDVDFPDNDYFDFYIDPMYADGYVWVFPRDGIFNVGIVATNGAKSGLEYFCREQMNIDPEKRILNDLGDKQNGGLIPRDGPIPQFSTKGAYVVGDSAGLTNPITKGGVHVGMLSGEYAAIAIGNELGSGKLVPPSHAINYHELRGQYWENCGEALHSDLESHVWYDRILKRQPWTKQKFVDQSKLIYSLDKRVLNLIGEIYDGRNYSDLPWLKVFAVLIKNPDLAPLAGKLLKIKASLKVTETYGW
ncbi:MAG: NAD(P)/FAD-dependent oxidoreductase [Candidatus Poseidoniia archaeon]|jgi:digeranylgeranylglycerophospholipid reductase|nr:NAD(P)/FAD-dependent oxidoreductase [Candidatus Poseidoniia archaeon]